MDLMPKLPPHHPEIGRELRAHELHERVVVISGTQKSPVWATVWVTRITPMWVVLAMGDVDASLILRRWPDGTLHQDTGEQVYIFEWLDPSAKPEQN